MPDKVLEKARTSRMGAAVKGASVFERNDELAKKMRQTEYTEACRDYRYIYPDFLTNPTYYFRDKIKEKLERQDMINRRKQISIPEFYVGQSNTRLWMI